MALAMNRESETTEATPKSEITLPRKLPAEGSMRDTIESIVFAFVLAFTFRAFIVEAFVIPTGSMAPTLLGQHLKAQCPQCGYRFEVGPDNSDSTHRERLDTTCPMCRMTVQETDSRPVSSGDRILVLKYLYAFSEPRRWDVVVFKNPQIPGNGQSNLQNYIKRLVGLPNEELKIVRGNVYRRDLIKAEDAKGVVYWRPPGPDDPDEAQRWQIVRKTHRPKIQRAVFQPVYHSDYVPLDDGKITPKSGREFAWTMPWQMTTEKAFEVERAGFWKYRGGETAGRLRFDFGPTASDEQFDPSDSTGAQTPFNYYAYNKTNPLSSNTSLGGSANIFEESRVSATVIPEAEGAELELATSSHDLLVRGRIESDGAVRLQVAERKGLGEPRWIDVGQGDGRVRLEAGRPTHVELWHVDQEVSLWVEDRCVDRFPYSLHWLYGELKKLITDKTPPAAPLESFHNYRPTPRAPVVSVSVAGPPALLRSVNLDRDLYHEQSHNGLGTSRSAVIGPDQFYCLGDNSPASLDSRGWSDIDPAVEKLAREKKYRHLQQGRPVEGLGFGLVPRELMIGRAFFVYWPAAHRVHHAWSGTVPNFTDMRLIR